MNDLQAIDLQVNKLRKLKDKLVKKVSFITRDKDNNAKLKRLRYFGLKVNIESACHLITTVKCQNNW